MDDRFRAITLWPEWAWAVCYLGKRIENRKTPPPKTIRGKRIAIHAGAHVGGRAGRPATLEGIAAVHRMGMQAGLTGDAVEGRCAFVYEDRHAWMRICSEGAVVLPPGYGTSIPRCVIVATAVVQATPFPPNATAPWKVVGEYGWVLDDVRVLSAPIPAKGKQGLWFPSDEAVAALRAQDAL